MLHRTSQAQTQKHTQTQTNKHTHTKTLLFLLVGDTLPYCPSRGRTPQIVIFGYFFGFVLIVTKIWILSPGFPEIFGHITSLRVTKMNIVGKCCCWFYFVSPWWLFPPCHWGSIPVNSLASENYSFLFLGDLENSRHQPICRSYLCS